jgi:ribonuclease P protein component
MTSSHGFPKSNRLLNARDYSNVFSNVDLRVSSQHFLCLASNNDQNTARLGIIAAKKNIRHAVSRNFVKRHLRESFRLNHQDIPPLDLVVMAKKNANELESSDLRKELQYLWRKLKRKNKT